MATLISDTAPWKDLKAHVGEIDKTHLRDLMTDTDRCKSMMFDFDGIFLDYSRQRTTVGTMSKLSKLAEEAHLKQKINSMFNGEHINSTENRSVLHVALRASKDTTINCDGKNVVPDVWQVLDKIREFSDKVRSGSWVGATGKALTNVIAIGIGGSFLGPLFVHTALQTDSEACKSAGGRQLRFLANVDPVDVARNISGLNPETTLVVVVSKTFTTAETMLNARTLREWISSALGPQAVSKHMVAVSTNLKLVEKFGIDPNNAFAFWDWVGGRYSVCSAVGVLPLSLQYGFSVIEKFLKGARSIDQHFHSSPFENNIPVLLGLLSVWNVSFLGYPARAILPYTQALEKLAPHIQQVSMESNGKGVSIDGVRLPFEAGEIDFGEPGTNGQHSFYQLIHQGRVIPCDFIGVMKSQQPVYLKDEVVNNHDELMSNFFAQPDALAYGKTPEQLQSENVTSNLVPHKTFTGNRPSLSLLLPSLDAYRIGQRVISAFILVLCSDFDGIFLDYSRQRTTVGTMSKLSKLAEEAHLKQKINSMFNGEHINSTENRSVLHVALRASKDTTINSDGKNVVPDVWQVLDKIREFSDKVRSGSWVGATGKALTNVIAIGIGGSFLGPLFVHTALQTDSEACKSAGGRQLRFLANVDPVDVARNISGLNPETTLVVVVSKTFTTAETMLNARTLREWISSALGPQAVSKHMVAVSTNLKLVEKFGIDPNNAFAFWDWVGGRYSVCSAVGVLPLSLQYGFSVIEKFLKGARSIDQHFHSSPFENNIPVLLGLLSVWNVSFLGYPARAILPYTQALEKLAPHIQQVSMESNGKGVSIDGVRLPFEAGEIDFGEPGTNGQHSFYQLIHQGRVIPCDFIGVMKSQQPVYLKDEVVNNHDELMSNFFAQPDALAYGKTPEQLQSENVTSNLVPHKTFTGNRPSLSLLLPSLDAYRIGQLLAIYEHRIAVEGFIWGINSFDQWGVELGKSLASQVRKQFHVSRKKGESVEGFNFSTTKLLTRYLEASVDVPSEPTTLLPRI
ncbi:hypothetical protein SSX86_025442 [Deinandra increscens subsp. villosa]|uniref:Glucose-6-phosphate isomerase n=1 Tax=Deinandra increscens subsp. villosa TaxID=3103831 RepID=A0AAP0CCN2_9ASTR